MLIHVDARQLVPLLRGLFPLQRPREQQPKLQQLFGVVCKLSHYLEQPIQLPADIGEVLERIKFARPHNTSDVRVVFPEPVCPTTIVTGYCSMQYRSFSPESSELEKYRKKYGHPRYFEMGRRSRWACSGRELSDGAEGITLSCS